jgi:hypothetical protein
MGETRTEALNAIAFQKRNSTQRRNDAENYVGAYFKSAFLDIYLFYFWFFSLRLCVEFLF